MNKLKPIYVEWKNPDASLQIKQKWERSPCQHQRAELDVTSRTVICAQCQEIIDAFDFLLDLCVMENSVLNKIESLKHTQKQLERNIHKIKRTQNNLL